MDRQAIGRLGGLSHHKRGPDYFRNLGRRGGQATARRLADEDFRTEWIDRVQMGKGAEPQSEVMRRRQRFATVFGVELP